MNTTAQTYRPGWGVFWMLVTGLQFVCVTALVRYLGTSVPSVEAAFLRYFLGLVFLLPVLGTLRAHWPDRAGLSLFALRGMVHTVGVALWFFAMARIPIADVTAMNYLSPIYVTIGAALFLGEKLALRRIVAIGVALIGALIILRPGFREVGPGHLAMLLVAVCFGASYLITKKVSGIYPPSVIVAMLSIVVTIGLAPLAISVWVWPSLHDLLILFLVAMAATGGHITMTLAFQAAPLAVTQPVTFLQLVWAVLLGALVFHEPVDPYVILGGSLIVGAICFISWREYRLGRRAVTPTLNATKS